MTAQPCSWHPSVKFCIHGTTSSLYAKTLLKTGGLSLETAAEPAVMARATPAFARSS